MFVLGVAVEKHIGQVARIPTWLSGLLVIASLSAMVAVNALWPLAHFLYCDAAIAVSAALLILVIVVDGNAKFLAIMDTRAVRFWAVFRTASISCISSSCTARQILRCDCFQKACW